MGILTKIREWASSGDREQPTDEYIAEGWQRLHRPPRQYWNWVENARDKMINAIVDAAESSRTTPGQAVASELCEGFVTATSKWHDPASFPNVLATGVSIKDACLGYDAVNEVPFLWVAYGDASIAKLTGPWEYDAAPSLSAAVTLDYPSTPDYVLAICCDADYLYVAWCVTDGDIQVTKFNASTYAEVWTTDTGMTSTTYGVYARLIVASTLRLALLLPGNCDDGAAVGEGVGILLKSDGTFTPGFGDWAGGAGYGFAPESGRLVSDGTHVYWLLTAANGPDDNDYVLHSAKITDPTTSDYDPLTICTVANTGTGADRPTGLICLGVSRLVAACPNGSTYILDPGNDDADDLVTPAEYGIGGANDNVEMMLGFDGLNVWIYAVAACFESVNGAMTLFKLPSGYCDPHLPNTGDQTEVWLNRIVLGEGETTSNALAGEFVFDGRDLWLLTPSGDIYRVTAPGLR